MRFGGGEEVRYSRWIRNQQFRSPEIGSAVFEDGVSRLFEVYYQVEDDDTYAGCVSDGPC